MTGFAHPELIASPEWLAENRSRSDVRVLDVRWRPDGTAGAVYAAGHIPEAVHLDWRESVVETPEGSDALLLAAPGTMAEAMGRAGVGDGTSAVLYDDTLSYVAARVWWSLRAYGYQSVRILDGGYAAWVEAGHRSQSGVTEARATTFTPRAAVHERLTTSDVRALLGAPGMQLVDARGPAEFSGFEGNVRRLGHIPGAVNLPVGAMHVPGTQRLRDAADLRAMVLKANITRGRRLVCYDGSGLAAAKLAFVLTLLGHDDVAVYDGGWAEWGERLDLPVDR